MQSFRQDDRTLTETKLYEIDDLAGMMRVHRAESILEMALHSDTVLFEFPTREFPVPADVYSKLRTEIGSLLGARIISQSSGRSSGTFMVEAKFAAQTSVDLAINTGLTIDGKQHKAIVTKSNNGELPKMVKLNVVGVPFEATDDLEKKLRLSLSHYGRVCRIRTIHQNGMFEGAISVLIDTDEAHGKFEPLQRMIYLEAWKIFVPVNYRGQPPACYHCRKSGHLKRECPILAALKCYRCDGTGHIARHCPKDILGTIKTNARQEWPVSKRQKNEDAEKNENEKENEKNEKNEQNKKDNSKKINTKEKEDTAINHSYDAGETGGGRSQKNPSEAIVIIALVMSQK
ncbi:unnamed protein product [Absidia cylindrospora]